MKRSLVVALFAALLVVQPATAAGYPSAESACGQTGGGETLVAIFPGASELQDNDSQVRTTEMRVYPGTEFRVALCKNRELTPTHGTEWSLESTPGLNVTDSTDSTVTVRVTDEKAAFDVAVKEKDLKGIAVAVRQPPTVDSALIEEKIRLENRSAADDYERAERQYLAALANLSNATDRLNASAAALESGEGNPENVTGTVLPAVRDGRRTLDERRRKLARRLYGTAWRSDRQSNALTALSAARQRERSADAAAKRATENYLESLKTAERNARTTAFVNLGGAALLGLLAGAVPGWWVTERKLDEIRFDQEINASVNTGPAVLARVAGLALVALVLTVAALVALGGFDTLGGLL